jgi:uncharacterized protein (TIGR02246 family)
MNKMLGLITLVALMLCVTTGFAQDGKTDVAFGNKYVEAYNKQDLAALATMWSENAVVTDRDTGSKTEGRKAILADIETVFKAHKEAKLAVEMTTTRLVNQDVMLASGQTTMLIPEQEPSISSFSVVLVKKEGKWIIDSLEQSAVTSTLNAQTALQELNWLVGQWVEETPNGKIQNNFRWSENKSFLLRSFIITDAEGIADQGTQIIGYDPRSQQIRSWTFHADGSFGDGVWTKIDNTWSIKSSQTLNTGEAASGTYLLSKEDDNTLSMQLIGHEIEGEPQPASPKVKITRQAESATVSQPNQK